MAVLSPFLPALLLGLFAFYCGNFSSAAGFPAGPIGQGLILITAVLAASSWRDPWRLGVAGRYLPWALVLASTLSLFASPVPRSGRVAVVLMPAFLLVPAFAARCWSTERRRALGVVGLSLVVGTVALWSLADALRLRLDRAAMPLGHHNLLAAFLAITLPLVVPGLRRAGAVRWLALSALLVGFTALLTTRSFLALAVVATVALANSYRLEKTRELVAGLALVALAFLVPRAAAIVAGKDSSASARAVYWRAAWDGFGERPVTGWGPGSTSWTIARTMHPIPGVSPAGEIVGQAHSLPLQLLRELGAPGAFLAASCLGLFFWRRWRSRSGAEDRSWVDAGLASVAAGLGCGLGEASLGIPAIALGLAVGAGAALAGAGAEPGAEDGGGAQQETAERKARRRAPLWPVVAYALLAATLLAPLARAQALYDRAVRVPNRALASPLLERAVGLDPGFPLYRARWAWSATAPIGQRAREALAAASQASGVAALWLRAGALALEAGEGEQARLAFEQAMALDPLSAFAPLQLLSLVADPASCAARALAADPRLAGATLFRGREALRTAAVGRVEVWAGIDAGWRAELRRVAATSVPGNGEEVDLTARIDGVPALALSLHLFRRTSWPADVARVRVERDAVRQLRALPAAAALPTSSAAAFPADRCAP